MGLPGLEGTTVETVRRRPGMFVGGHGDDAVLQLIFEVLGNAVDQHLLGRCSNVTIVIGEDGTISISDDGPGFAANGGNGVPPLDDLLTTFSDRPTVDGHRPHVHVGLRGLGLFVVNALTERFEIVTVRRGVEARATFARGAIVKPTRTKKTTRPSGTTIRFRPDRQIFPHAHVPRAKLAHRIEDLSFLVPKLAVAYSVGIDRAAAGGLRSRVALDVNYEVAEVAYHRKTYKTSRGPLDVEVALAWQPWTDWRIDSFVNLYPTVEGSHVDGVLDAVREEYGTGAEHGITACVSVILADVSWGSPTKARLATPEVRAPVAAATIAALGVKDYRAAGRS